MRKRFKIYNLKFMIGTAFLVCVLLFAVNAFAQEASPEPSPSPDERIQEKVEERIEKVIKSAEEKKKRALVGTLESISNSTLTIETRRGNFQAKVDTDTTIISTERKTIELEDLELGSKLICMGYFNERDILETKRIVAITKFQVPTTEVAFGVVSDISQEEKVLTVKHPKKESIYTVEVDAKTKITKKVEGKIQTVEFSDIEENDRLVAIGEPGENEEKIITAKLIHIIPGKAVGWQSPTPEAFPVTEEE